MRTGLRDAHDATSPGQGTRAWIRTRAELRPILRISPRGTCSTRAPLALLAAVFVPPRSQGVTSFLWNDGKAQGSTRYGPPVGPEAKARHGNRTRYGMPRSASSQRIITPPTHRPFGKHLLRPCRVREGVDAVPAGAVDGTLTAQEREVDAVPAGTARVLRG